MELELQIATEADNLPQEEDFCRWGEAVLVHMGREDAGEVVIRIVDEVESAELNEQYRNKQGATNVLSFPFEAPPGVPAEELPLGDLVICTTVVAREAAEQGKMITAHWAHMVVHGVLHLLGLDHIDPQEAEAMEAREVEVLATLGFADPYA